MTPLDFLNTHLVSLADAHGFEDTFFQTVGSHVKLLCRQDAHHNSLKTDSLYCSMSFSKAGFMKELLET